MQDSRDIYAGLTGVTLDSPELDLGLGIRLSPTYAQLKMPFLMLFSPALPGGVRPFKTVHGGSTFDISVQLAIPAATAADLDLDPRSVVWLVTAVLRLRVGPSFVVPVYGRRSFESVGANASGAAYSPVEVDPAILELAARKHPTITGADARWVDSYLPGVAGLLADDSFGRLLEATDLCQLSRIPSAAMLWLWCGLEAVFCPSSAELRYRVSAALASFLEPPGSARMELFKTVQKLYDSRSGAAHGRKDPEHGLLQQTHGVARRALIKMIEDNHVPSQAELEACVLGVGPA